MTELEQLHVALRRERTATAALRRYGNAYTADPTDWNGIMFHAAWCDLRDAVDALVALPRLDVDTLALAVRAENTPKGTE